MLENYYYIEKMAQIRHEEILYDARQARLVGLVDTLTMKAMGLLQKPKIGDIPIEIKELTVSIPKINSTEILIEIMSSTLHVDDIAGCVAYGMLLFSKVKKGDHCLVLGASGGIGSVITQMLKSKGAIVTGLCSTRNIEMVKANGADYVIDYTKDKFVEKLTSQNKIMDLIFDTVGGKELENDSIKVLQKKGKFLTVCGPEKYIGSKKLSWGKVISMFWYIIYRSLLSKIIGPAYKFSEKTPSTTIDEMFDFVIKNNIEVPIDRVIPLQIKELKEALKHLAAHKASGRIVIDVTK